MNRPGHTMDLSDMEQVTNAPDASSLMLTARSFGNYDLAGALADLIDNSIKAGSRLIEIDCQLLASGDCEVRIRDDGGGMAAAELKAAMRPASSNPEDERSEDDLGRFGWGMKSASFSQCRQLTVVSCKDGAYSAASWDLDNIDNWAMGFCTGHAARSLLHEPFQGESGTELVWANCDRLSEDRSITRDQFNEAVSEAGNRLSLIFHRYLSGDQGRYPKIGIMLNNTGLEQQDPFCRGNTATIEYPEEPISVQKNGRRHNISMQAFVLPHYSKISELEYSRSGGKEGYLRNQGFYVYRNRRLIIHGTWFGLVKHGELSKLVRVQIDVPNSLDEMWKITVDKSDAQMPAALRSKMKELIESFRGQSSKVMKSKGVQIGNSKSAPVWTRRVRHGRIRYVLNREHPLLLSLKQDLDAEQQKLLAAVFQMAETQVPVDVINHEVSSSPHELEQNFTSREEVTGFLRASLTGLMMKAGAPEALLELLGKTEPYASNMTIVEEEIREIFGNE